MKGRLSMYDSKYLDNVINRWSQLLDALEITDRNDIAHMSMLCENLQRQTDDSYTKDQSFIDNFRVMSAVYRGLKERGHIVGAMAGPVGFHYGGRNLVSKCVLEAFGYKVSDPDLLDAFLDSIKHKYVYLYTVSHVKSVSTVSFEPKTDIIIRLAQANNCCDECGFLLCKGSCGVLCDECKKEHRKARLKSIKDKHES